MLKIKVIFYLNKVRKLKDNFFSNLPKEIGTKRNKFVISVIVLDLKTKQSYVYVSIAEAARSFNTYPKTIWRVVYNNKLYLNRYQIIEKNNKLGVWNFMFKLYKNIYEYFYCILNRLKSNRVFIDRTLFFIVLGIIICIKNWRYEYLFNHKWTSIQNTKSELGIYKSIINEINLAFNSKGT